ncbi:sensor histidine kinase [Niabella sp. CJ426]|uniref:sensor histidine kinase n=1 Tax=Niabella sp. CJ426 TaxID=3393740 RepID=UPI003D038DC0
MTNKLQTLRPLLYWLISFSLLLFIYGTAYGSYELGIVVVLILLPVHMCYFYLISNWILPRFFFRDKYIQTFLLLLLTMPLIAILYRLVEVYITNPYIFKFYTIRDSSFSWPSLSLSKWKQLTHPGDFVNAIERTNTVAWICVTIKLFILWNERKQVILQSELNFLKGQLHPHFLFNSLNNLYALSLNNSPQTPEVVLGLSNILRYILYECASEQVLLKRDIEILSDYISLEKLRYEKRLELNVNMTSPANDVKISPLLMLPLVENAFKHGAAETTETPWIDIDLYIHENTMIFKVANSKPEQPIINNGNQQFNGIGLRNLQQRLDLLYPGRHTFTYLDEADCFIAELNIQLYLKGKRS